MKSPEHRIVKFPKSRLATFDIGAAAKRKHAVSAYLEFDVTLAREKVRSAKEHGARITFTAWLLKTIGDAIGRHKEIAAFRLGRRRLMVFDDAHISIIVERERGGRKIPRRAAGAGTAGDVHCGNFMRLSRSLNRGS